jgi:hypothetical protein
LRTITENNWVLAMNTSFRSSPVISHDAITARARDIWLSRNRPIGMDEEIWFEAERQLAAELRARTGPVSNKRTPKVAVDIDEQALADRLADFGEAASRGPTSIDPTK